MKIRASLFALLFLALSCSQPPDQEFDLLIVGGEILDGSGEAAYRTDIGIKGDQIIWMGEAEKEKKKAFKTIDAAGYTVTPGFIDPHTHAGGDLEDSLRNANLNYLTQGVTTVFIGSDGRSHTDLGGLFEKFERQGIGTNVASFVGHSTVRRQVMGMRDDAPTEEEMQNMKTLVERGMDAGAIGLGSGLYYAPASYAETEEVIELAKIAAARGGVYDVHMRDESSYSIGLLGAVEETIRISEEAGLPANMSHLKCLGADVWGKSAEVIKIVEAARARGVQITADQYPYRASSTSLTSALVPRWVLADDPDPSVKFDDPSLRPRIIAEMKENIRRRGGPETLLLTHPSKKNIDLKGLTLAQVAEKWEIEAVEAAIRIVLNGSSSVGSFNMQEDDIVRFMAQPWVMSSSDGSTGHPRKYGSFPKKIKEYTLEKKVLDLPATVCRYHYL